MKVRRFDPHDDLIIVKARVFGRHGNRPLLLALDTAASLTHISSDIIHELAYSPAEGEAITSVRSAIGKESGLHPAREALRVVGLGFDDFLIHVHDLPSGYGIDGLLGLSFLKRFNYEIRSVEGRIIIGRATT